METRDNSSKKVLLVDDDPLIIRMYEHKLSQDGYQIALAFNGEDAVEKAKSEKPDIILLDLMMPKMNGVEALKILKKDAGTKKIPVLVLTNLADDHKYVDLATELGAKDYIVKAQISLKELAHRVSDVVHKK